MEMKMKMKLQGEKMTLAITSISLVLAVSQLTKHVTMQVQMEAVMELRRE